MSSFDSYEFLSFTRHGNGVLLEAMNRPEKKNAMNPAVRLELSRVSPDIDADSGTRVVVLTGAGDAFSEGGAIVQAMVRLRFG